MKKLVIALSAICLTICFSSCDEDFYEGFREGWNSTAPSEWHFAPEHQGDVEGGQELVEENVNE
ncbi:MAG: hypothetical protein MJZ58_02765 [Paludibacteraceae bacterium]|nr:hypothetical protein [Paludibacteraceae bacterium]